MTMHDIEVLIECKRLVEKLYWEKKRLLSQMEGHEKEAKIIHAQMLRFERALEGRPDGYPIYMEKDD